MARGTTKPKSATATASAGEVVTSQDVANRLKDRIRKRKLVPGQRLVEADIMQETGATRGRVREALQRLAVEGLVVIEEFRGASVRQLTREDARHVNRAREVLEGLAARLFAEAGSEGDKARLSELQAEMERLEQARELEAYGRANEHWHSLIISASGNPYIEQFVDRLRLQIMRLQTETFYANDGARRSNEEHRRITEAILRGDGDAAEALMRAHIGIGLSMLEALDDDFFS